MATRINNDTIYAWYIKFQNGVEIVWGPYSSAGVAQAQLTRELNSYARNVIDSGIRVGKVTWETCEVAKNKKERAAQLKAKRAQKKADREQAARDKFWEELNS